MGKPDKYVGVDNDMYGGMTTIGKIIRDAWVFGILDEDENCEDWNLAGIDALMQKVNAEWDKHDCLVSHLPKELAERHRRIHGKAFLMAQNKGWSGELETCDEG